MCGFLFRRPPGVVQPTPDARLHGDTTLTWLLLTPALAQDLTVRVQDTTARPGHYATIVLSTYEPRPIEQGQLGVLFQGIPVPTPTFAAAYATLGDAVLTASPTPTGALSLAMSSATGTINAEDGPMIVLWYQIPATALPGTTFRVGVDPNSSWLVSDAGVPLVIDPKAGVVTVSRPDAPFLVSAEGDKIRPGELARISIQTTEPLPLSGGTLVFRYPPQLAAGPPQVSVRSRSTTLSYTADTSQPGVIRATVTPDTRIWNWVPSALVDITIPTPRSAPVGAVVPIWLDRAETTLWRASGQPLPLSLASGAVEFR